MWIFLFHLKCALSQFTHSRCNMQTENVNLLWISHKHTHQIWQKFYREFVENAAKKIEWNITIAAVVDQWNILTFMMTCWVKTRNFKISSLRSIDSSVWQKLSSCCSWKMFKNLKKSSKIYISLPQTLIMVLLKITSLLGFASTHASIDEINDRGERKP